MTLYLFCFAHTVTPKVNVEDVNPAIAGQNMTLPCYLGFARPNTIIDVQWEKDRVNITGDRYTGSTKDTPSLTIKSVRMSDKGNYVCKMTNAVGTGRSRAVSLTVYG